MNFFINFFFLVWYAGCLWRYNQEILSLLLLSEDNIPGSFGEFVLLSGSYGLRWTAGLTNSERSQHNIFQNKLLNYFNNISFYFYNLFLKFFNFILVFSKPAASFLGLARKKSVSVLSINLIWNAFQVHSTSPNFVLLLGICCVHFNSYIYYYWLMILMRFVFLCFYVLFYVDILLYVIACFIFS